jgi:hypothetical protein
MASLRAVWLERDREIVDEFYYAAIGEHLAAVTVDMFSGPFADLDSAKAWCIEQTRKPTEVAIIHHGQRPVALSQPNIIAIRDYDREWRSP